MIHKTLLFLFVTTSCLASALQLSDSSYLNKLSLSIRGISPSMDEYTQLEKAKSENQKDHFFALKRQQYLGSSLYADKMRWRIVEWMKLRSSTDNVLLRPELKEENSRQNSTDDFLLRFLNDDQPWDFLITGQGYKIHPRKEFDDFGTDLEFYETVLPKEWLQSFHEHQSRSALFSPTQADGRFAGILTTPRFFSRYTTTAVNKSRRRAAAIFRAFLCDDMLAAVPDPSENKKQILDLQLPENLSSRKTEFSEVEIRAAMQMGDDAHGTQADCKSCHYKLDPMGEVFRGSRSKIASQPWPGALSYRNSNGELVDLPVKSIKELGQAIVAQDDYVSCQVKQFWTWFIGKDKELDPDTLKELINQFESVNRKPGQFINLLVQRAEFKTRSVDDPSNHLSRQVMTVFKKCQSCHEGKEDDVTGEPLINLTVWPLGKNSSEKNPLYWLERVSKKLDLENGGQNRTMPPRKSGWNLTRSEMVNIQNWIENEKKGSKP